MLSLIDRLLSMDRNETEQWTVWSFVDNYAKYLSTLDNSSPYVDQLFAICKKHGFIPQYNISGPSVFVPNGTKLSSNSKYLITQDLGGVMISASGLMRPIVFVYLHNNYSYSASLSPDSKYLAVSYIVDQQRYLQIWNLDTLMITYETKHYSITYLWGKNESVFYVDETSMVVKTDLNSLETQEIIGLIEGTVDFSINEDLNRMLSFGKDFTTVDNLEDGSSTDLDLRLSVNAWLFTSKDGFRALSGGKLYKINETYEMIWHCEKSCRMPESNNYGEHFEALLWDGDEPYITSETHMYYLNKDGMVSRIETTNLRNRPAYHHSETWEKFNDMCPELLAPENGNLMESDVTQKVDILQKLKTDGKGAFIGSRGDLIVAEYRGEKRGFPIIVAVRYECRQFTMSMTPGTYLDPVLFDFEDIPFDYSLPYSIDNYGIGIKAYASIKNSTSLDPVAKALFACNRNLPKQETHDGAHSTICIQCPYLNTILMLTDFTRVKILPGHLISRDYTECDASKDILLVQEKSVSRISPDGSVVELTGVPKTYGISVYGNSALWTENNKLFLNGKDITEEVNFQNGKASLISEDTVVIVRPYSYTVYKDKVGLTGEYNLDTLGHWNVLGVSDTGYVSMCHYVMEKELVTADFAELKLQDGTFSEKTGNIRFKAPLGERLDLRGDMPMWPIFDLVDFRKQKIIHVDRYGTDSAIYSYDLSKGSIALNRNALVTNMTKKWLKPVPLSGGRYFISTTEYDEEGHKKTKAKIDRPEIRIMNSETGQRIKRNGKSGGIMYGCPGHYLRDDVSRILVSPDEEYIFVHYNDGTLQSFEISTETSYPAIPLKGVALVFKEPKKVIIGIQDGDKAIRRCTEYDYRLQNHTAEKQMVTEAHNYGNTIEYTLKKGMLDNRFRVIEGNYSYSKYVNNAILLEEIEQDSDTLSLALAHVTYGLLDTATSYSMKYPKSIHDELDWSQAEKYVEKNIHISSSHDIIAVFDTSTLEIDPMRDSYPATIICGEHRMTIEIQNPFDLRKELYCLDCPISVNGNTYAYSRTVDGMTVIELHRIDSEGNDLLLKSMIMDKTYQTPIFADESLVITQTDQGEFFHSSDWKNFQKTDFDKHVICTGQLHLQSKTDGIYTFNERYGIVTFEKNMLEEIDERRTGTHELKLDNGTLKWNFGVMVLTTN